MTSKQIKAEIIDVMGKTHNQPVKVKWLSRWRRITYPTGIQGYIGRVLITAKGYKPTIFYVDRTDGYRTSWTQAY